MQALKDGRITAPSWDAVTSVARVFGCSPLWLADGSGGPFPEEDSGIHAPISDPYPSRAAVVELLRARDDVPPGVVQALRSMVLPTPEDPGRQYWLRIAGDLIADARALEEMLHPSGVAS